MEILSQSVEKERKELITHITSKLAGQTKSIGAQGSTNDAMILSFTWAMGGYYTKDKLIPIHSNPSSFDENGNKK